MTTGSTVEVHHLFEGPEEAPVLVLSNTPGTTLGMWDEQAPALSESYRLLRYDYRSLCFPRFRRGIYEGGQG
jgi:hypothetical protein